MKNRYKILFSVICAIAALAWLSFAYLPWKDALGNRLQLILETNGLKGARLTLSDLGLNSTTFQNIAFGDNNFLTLRKLTISYSPLELWRGHPREITASGIAFDSGNGSGIKASAANADVSGNTGKQDNGWEGTWRINDIQVETGYIDLPLLNGSGSLRAATGSLLLAGNIKSKDSAYHAEFTLNYPSEAKLLRATMPWKSGTVSVNNVIIPLVNRQAIKVPLQIKDVPIDGLMQDLTGKRVSATGEVSGILPVTIGNDDSISIGKGELKANGPGIITMPPDAIPGDNEQVVMTREILKNFHYVTLSISLSSNNDGRISVLAALEGNNPDMYNGRQVKLNVRLGGDVLNFIRQNMLIMTDTKTMLEAR